MHVDVSILRINVIDGDDSTDVYKEYQFGFRFQSDGVESFGNATRIVGLQMLMFVLKG